MVKENKDALDITIDDIRSLAIRYLVKLSYGQGVMKMIYDLYPNDMIITLKEKIFEKRMDIKASYDSRPLPTDNFSYPDYKNEIQTLKAFEDKLEEDFSRDAIGYLTSIDRVLLQIRYIVLWNIAALAHSFNVPHRHYRQTLDMVTDVLIYNITGIESEDSNRKDRLLEYNKNYSNVPAVKDFLDKTGLNILLRKE